MRTTKAIGDKFAEDKHPRDKGGKFASSDERAAVSLKDPDFVRRHGVRLSRAGDEARENFPGDRAGSDEAAAAAASHIHGEAKRIHAEEDEHGGDEELKGLAEQAHETGAAQGKYLEDRHERAMGWIKERKAQREQAKADRANEDASIEAGHLTTEARDIADEYEAGAKARQGKLDDHARELAAAHGEAAQALADLHAFQDGLADDLEHTRSLGDDFDITHGALSEGGSTVETGDREFDEKEGRTAPDVAGEHDAPPDPDDWEIEDYSTLTAEDLDAGAPASKEEHDEMRATYEQWKKDRTAADAEFKSRAERAQDALERLHEKQIAASSGLKEIDDEGGDLQEKALSKLDEMEEGHHVRQDAFKDAKRFGDDEDDEDDELGEPGEIKDAEIRAAYDRAHSADESMREHARSRIEEGGSVNVEDARDALKEETAKTARALKELARITGRKPKLPEKPAKKPAKPKKSAKKPAKPKKSANRPGAGGAASVCGMARYKLKLSKLDFLSLVDEPAQQTAKVRLIKRAGAADEVHAEMRGRIVKLVDGTDPLVYAWAFTCTDDTGQPYHDLQGDAVSADDFVKAAEEYMRAGGAVDEMHDGKATEGRIAFAFPMDSTIATAMLGKAAGDATKTSGLMIAIRPTAEQLLKLRSGEYTGVSIAGTGVREVLEKGKRKPKRRTAMAMPYKGRVSKMSVLTSLTNGHQHALCPDDPEHAWTSTLTTSYATSEGATDGHSHAWTYDMATGAITIGEDSGHTHTVDVVVPTDVLAAVAREDEERRCPGCGAMCANDDRYCCCCGRSMCGESAPAASATPTMVVVAARAPAGKSSPSGSGGTVGAQEQEMATEQELQKRIAHLEKLNTLTDAQRAYHDKLSGQAAETFLAKSGAERDQVLADIVKADEVVYTATDGSVFRKSDDPRLVAAVKRADESARDAALEKAARQQVELEKRAAAELSHFAKSAGTRAAILRAIDGIADEAVRKEALEAVKSANFALSKLAAPHGGQGDAPEGDAKATYNAELAEFAKSKNKTPGAATAEFIRTERGANLYAEAYPRTNA